MSHELRTPMNAIIGFSDMIRSEIFGPIKPVEYADYAEHILHSGKLMQTHIDDLLDHARLESGKMSWTDEDFSLNDVIDSWLATCESAASDRGVNLTCAAPLPDVTINGDPARIEQVVINLMNNAIKFTPPGGAVSVGATLAPGGALQITVTDNGCGISDQDLQRIKQPFVQLDDREYVTGKGGLGLGLAIVSGILAMMQGRLELTSEEGVGTVAMVEIPAKRIEGVSRAA
jgi:cell cycle sensor histidine kinase DivJ